MEQIVLELPQRIIIPVGRILQSYGDAAMLSYLPILASMYSVSDENLPLLLGAASFLAVLWPITLSLGVYDSMKEEDDGEGF